MEENTNIEAEQNKSVEVEPSRLVAVPIYTAGLAITPFAEVIPTKCKKHSKFRGLRRPSNGCNSCMALYQYARATGVRETRKRKPKEAN